MMTTKEKSFSVLTILLAIALVGFSTACSSNAITCSQDNVTFYTTMNSTGDNNVSSYYLTIVSPEQNDNYSNDFFLTVNSNLPSIWFEYEGRNETYSGSTIVTFDDGEHTLKVFGKDADNRIYESEVTFWVNKQGDDDDEDDEDDDCDDDDDHSSKKKKKSSNSDDEITYTTTTKTSPTVANAIIQLNEPTNITKTKSDTFDFNWSYFFYSLMLILVFGICLMLFWIIAIYKEDEEVVQPNYPQQQGNEFYENVY